MRIVYLSKKGVSVISLKLGNRGLWGILTVSLISCIISWVLVTLVYILHPEIRFLEAPLDLRLTSSRTVRLVGLALIVSALVIYVAALLTLGSSWRVGAQEDKNGELVTRGVYAVSRNPIYVFFALYFTGTFLINGAFVFLIFTIMAILNLHHLTLSEEGFLLSTYGVAFKKYLRETGRYITWRRVWPVSLWWGREKKRLALGKLL